MTLSDNDKYLSGNTETIHTAERRRNAKEQHLLDAAKRAEEQAALTFARKEFRQVIVHTNNLNGYLASDVKPNKLRRRPSSATLAHPRERRSSVILKADQLESQRWLHGQQQARKPRAAGKTEANNQKQNDSDSQNGGQPNQGSSHTLVMTSKSNTECPCALACIYG